MKIYTSYFAKEGQLLANNILPISITLKPPAKYCGIQYKFLAPKKEFFYEWKKTHDNEFYIREFQRQVLDQLNAKEVYQTLKKIGGGFDVALICYEKPDDFCHRHLVADWLSKELSIEVKEINI